MLARWFLALLLLIHPVQGVLAAGPEARPVTPATVAADPCGADGCCPICTELDTCLCIAAPGQDRDPAPVAPPTTNDAPRVITSGGWAIWSGTARAAPTTGIAGARAPPAVAPTVNAFLSIVCVWTT